MVKYVVRKLGSTGDTCVAEAEDTLEGHLRQELEQGYSAAIHTGDSTSFVGNDIGRVMETVKQVAADAEEVEVLLIPPVAGGQLPPPLFVVKEAIARTGEIHMMLAPNDEDFHMAEGMFYRDIYPKILKCFSITEEVFFIDLFSPSDFFYLLDDFFTNGHTDLKIYLHDIRTDVRKTIDFNRVRREGPKAVFSLFNYRCTCIGTLSIGNGGSYILNGRVKLDDEEILRKWLIACWESMWIVPLFSQPAAEKLAEAIVEYLQKGRRRAFKTLKRTLGGEVAKQLRRSGYVTVESANGRKYKISKTGEVTDVLDGRYVCVEVENEEELPSFDRVLAKYLVIRDHPEQIDTLPTSPPEPAVEKSKVASWVYLCKCGGCSLHFAVFSWFAGKTWKCPECGSEVQAVFMIPSEEEISALFEELRIQHAMRD